MSLLPTGSYANPTQPLWVPFGGGGGGGGYPLDASFNSVFINPAGVLNFGNDNSFSNAYMNFYRTADGTSTTSMGMLWAPGTSAPFNDPNKLALTVTGPTGGYDRFAVGQLSAVGLNPYGTSNALNISDIGMAYGPIASPLFSLFTVSSNSWDVTQLTSINGKELSQAGTDTCAGNIVTVSLPRPYADASYAVVVTPFSADTMWVTSNTPSNFEVNTTGSNTSFAWIAMPYT